MLFQLAWILFDILRLNWIAACVFVEFPLPSIELLFLKWMNFYAWFIVITLLDECIITQESTLPRLLCQSQ